MPIEEELKTLTAAIKQLITVIKESSEADEADDVVIEPKAQPKKQAAKEVVKEKPVKAKPKDELFDEDEEDEDEDEDELEEISKNKTASEVKTLAQEKIAAGTNRASIKKMVSKLGAESITDLDQKNLNTLYSQLQKL